MDIKHCFDMSGNLLFDAFRTDRNDPRYIAVFDEYGNLNDENNTENKLRKLVKNCNWSPWCDAVGIIHAEKMANGTKGNYHAIHYFR